MGWAILRTNSSSFGRCRVAADFGSAALASVIAPHSDATKGRARGIMDATHEHLPAACEANFAGTMPFAPSSSESVAKSAVVFSFESCTLTKGPSL